MTVEHGDYAEQGHSLTNSLVNIKKFNKFTLFCINGYRVRITEDLHLSL